jgi:Na+/proline symporter
MMTTVAIASLLISCVLYGLASSIVGRRHRSAKDYFHTKDVSGGLITIVLGNLTLGTGLIYNSTLSSTQGLFSLWVPFGVLVGYWLLYRLSRTLDLGENQGLISSLRIDGKRPWFLVLFVIIMIGTYIFLIAFEIFVSAQLLAALVAPHDPKSLSASIAIVLLLVALGYTVIGGIRGVILTDRIQLVAVGAMLMLIFACSLRPEWFGIPSTEYQRKPPEWFPNRGDHVIVAVLIGISTGFAWALVEALANWDGVRAVVSTGSRRKPMHSSPTANTD